MEPNNRIYDTIVQAREKQANAKTEYEDEYLNDLNRLEDGEEATERLIPGTVRFGENVHKIICDMAKEYGCSFAEVVRIAVDDLLEKHFNNMVYVDTQTGKDVEKLMGEIGTELHAIKVELNRIGCNYNQELKVKRMEAKRREVLEQLAEKDLPDDVKAEMKKKYSSLEVMIQTQQKNVPQLSKAELENLTERFEKTADKVGRELWKTLRM